MQLVDCATKLGRLPILESVPCFRSAVLSGTQRLHLTIGSNTQAGVTCAWGGCGEVAASGGVQIVTLDEREGGVVGWLVQLYSGIKKTGM